MTKNAQYLAAPYAPLPMPFDPDEPTPVDVPLGAPAVGENLHFAFTVSFRSTQSDPWGKETVSHLVGFLRSRDFELSEIRLAVPVAKLPSASAIKRRNSNLALADELRERSRLSRGG